jgi:hypothetical protein
MIHLFNVLGDFMFFYKGYHYLQGYPELPPLERPDQPLLEPPDQLAQLQRDPEESHFFQQQKQ